jgi:UDPglucose 6-dehydrogenase
VRVCVAGLWHLGVVTAACVAGAGYDVVAYDEDSSTVADLDAGRLPVDEPGLSQLVRQQAAAGRLEFTADRERALRNADLLWIAYDTPVDGSDHADVESVVTRARALLEALDETTAVIVSSQLPVGTTRRLEQSCRAAPAIAYSPENLRLGNAIAAFTKPDRVVVGIRPGTDRSPVEQVLGAFTNRIEWMSVESAELTKHALNAFLATSIAFANEVASVAERVGADARDVARGLKTDARIGPGAYLRPGAAFAGGTLARDVAYLVEIGERESVPVRLVQATLESNEVHKLWSLRSVRTLLARDDGRLEGFVIGVWGLVYTTGTDTLRRSNSVELCRELARAGATVRAHDAAIHALPTDLSSILTLCDSPLVAAADASAVVVETDWPQYRDIDAESLVRVMRAPNVVDANAFLKETLGRAAPLRYVTVGSSPS